MLCYTELHATLQGGYLSGKAKKRNEHFGRRLNFEKRDGCFQSNRMMQQISIS